MLDKGLANCSDSECEQWLWDQYGKESFKSGFDRLKKFYRPNIESLSKKQTKVVTIAGTNGKGETAFALFHLLKKQKKKVSLWSSPHILTVRERFQSQEGMIGLKDFASLIQSTHENQDPKKELSYYEFLFLCFLNWCEKINPEILILEVGMGGRLDAVNHLDASLTALTSISRDHTEFLGETLEEILTEKIAVNRANGLCIGALEGSFLRDKALAHAAQKGFVYRDLFLEKVLSEEDSFSTRNKILALALYSELNSFESGSDLRKEVGQLDDFSAKARGEKVTLGSKTFTFIGSHNIDGIRKLIHQQRKAKAFDLALMAFSKRDESDIRQMIALMLKAPCVSPHLMLCDFEHPKAWINGEQITRSRESSVVKLGHSKNWKEWTFSEEQNSKQNILVTGSYYFIGEVQKYLRQSGAEFSF